MQNKADITGLPIDVPEVEEATSRRGHLGGDWDRLVPERTGCFRTRLHTGRTYHPDLQLTSRYAEWYRIYRQLYPVLKPISHQLYDQFRPDPRRHHT